MHLSRAPFIALHSVGLPVVTGPIVQSATRHCHNPCLSAIFVALRGLWATCPHGSNDALWVHLLQAACSPHAATPASLVAPPSATAPHPQRRSSANIAISAMSVRSLLRQAATASLGSMHPLRTSTLPQPLVRPPLLLLLACPSRDDRGLGAARACGELRDLERDLGDGLDDVERVQAQIVARCRVLFKVHADGRASDARARQAEDEA